MKKLVLAFVLAFAFAFVPYASHAQPQELTRWEQQARSVTIELTQEDGQLHLTVHDDGVGFHVGRIREAAQRGASLGLLGMEERAVLAGGGLELESSPGGGTRIHAWFPLKWR